MTHAERLRKWHESMKQAQTDTFQSITKGPLCTPDVMVPILAFGSCDIDALLAGAEALEALKTIRDEVLNTDANMLNNDQINYVLGIIDNYMSLPEPPKEGE